MKKIIVLLLLLTAGCNAPTPETSQLSQRIVSLAPAITEILFAIGAGDQVVGVTTYCNYPVAVEKLPRVGNFATIDFEKIISLRPDLVIATRDGNPQEAVVKLRTLGIETLVIGGKSFKDLLSSINLIGRSVNRRREAQSLAGRLEIRWKAIGEKHASTQRPKILLLYGIDPLVAAGKGSLGDELIAQAGGKNIFAGSSKQYVTTEHEKIISLAPEVIVQVTMGSESTQETQEYWSKWYSIPAVKNGRVCVLDPDLITRPGPRIIEGLNLLAKAIHGETTGK